MKNHIKQTAIVFFTLLTIILFYTCDVNEKVEDPCGDDLEFLITGNYTLLSEDKQIVESYPASNAKVEIYKSNNDPEQADSLIDSGRLDGSGKYIFMPEKSGCGINNLYFSVIYEETFSGMPIYHRTNIQDYLCCDDKFDFEFEEFMTDGSEISLECENLNQDIQMDITNRLGACIPKGSEISALFGNKLTTSELDNILIDISPLTNMENGFWVDTRSGIYPQPNEEGEVFLNNQKFSITFGVETEVDSFYQAVVEMPVSCVDDNGEASEEGKITVTLTADVCDNSVTCTCPIGGNEIFPENLRDLKIASTAKTDGENFSSGDIGSLIDVELADGCRLFVNDIIRQSSPGKDAFNSNDEAWNIVDPGMPVELKDFYGFEIIANFTPTTVEEYSETFEVFISVNNEDDTDIKDCSFLITFKGKGCNDVCADIIIKNENKGFLNNTVDGSTQYIDQNDTLSFDEATEIHQEFSGLLSNSCIELGGDSKSITYSVIFPDDIEDYCSDPKINFSKLNTTGDENHFSINTLYNVPFSIGVEQDLKIKFFPPSIQEHVNSNHDDSYIGRFRVDILSADDRLICSQIIHIDAEVKQIDFSESEKQIMHSFSQKSELDTNPAYRVYQIGWKKDDSSFGRVISLNKNNIDELETGHSVPGSSVDAAFYFDVDDPNDTDKNNEQLPKLYLVDSDNNEFDYVTEIPVDYFSNANEFRDDRQDLIRRMFSSTGFTSPYNSTSFSFSPEDTQGRLWNHSTHKSEFISGNGIELELGGVYILWSSNASTLSGLANNVFGGYCDVALLYITEIDHGKGINTHNISSVSFVVGYPLEIVK